MMKKSLLIAFLALCLSIQFSAGASEPPDEKQIIAVMDKLIDNAGEVSDKNRKAAEKHIKKGIKYHDRGNFDKAVVEYKKAIEKDPLNAPAYYELSMTQYSQQDLTGSYENAVRAIAIDPAYEDPYIMKASALDDLGYPDLAISEYKRLLEINPKSFMAWLNMCITFMKEDGWVEGEHAMHQASELNSAHPSPYYYLMIVSSAQGFNYEEEEYARKFLAVGKSDPRRKTVEEHLKEMSSVNLLVTEGREITTLYLIGQMERALWRSEKHRKNYPDERGYKPSLKEESAVMEVMFSIADNKNEITEQERRFMADMRKLKQLGYLDAYSYVKLEKYLGADDLRWGDENRKLIDEFKEWSKHNAVLTGI